jgi:hypothetical protein
MAIVFSAKITGVAADLTYSHNNYYTGSFSPYISLHPSTP